MILCPNCQHHEITGALYCGECGGQLINVADDSTRTAQYTQGEPTVADAMWPAQSPYERVDNNDRLSLLIVSNQQVLPLVGTGEHTIGRFTDELSVAPDVDLSPYGAYDYGVSRIHATITVKEQITVKDMESINGTRVNGNKIPPNTPHPLVHCDMLTLGTMKIQVLITH